MKDSTIFYAFENNSLTGTICLKDNKVLGLYINHNIHKKGIGTALLKHLETYAKKKDIRKLTLTSTPFAYPFYRKRGYIPIKKVDVAFHGIFFKEWKMEKMI
jgi:putative acetyltransferase